MPVLASAMRRIGIGLVSRATLCFATLDACAKWRVASLPVFERVFARMPDAFVVAGSPLVVTSGRWLLWLEMRQR